MRYVGLLITALTLPITVIADSHERSVGITSTLMEQEVMHDNEAPNIRVRKWICLSILIHQTPPILVD